MSNNTKAQEATCRARHKSAFSHNCGVHSSNLVRMRGALCAHHTHKKPAASARSANETMPVAASHKSSESVIERGCML